MTKPILSFEQLINEIGQHAEIDWLIPDVLPIIRLGPNNAEKRLFVDCGTHGQEMATPRALLEFVKRHGQDWKWPNVQLMSAIVDAAGLDEVGYGFVGVDGSSSCWPPLWGYRMDDGRYWTYVDFNSAWGNMALRHLPEVHKKLRELICDYQPTFVYCAHETVENETKRHPFWTGCGLLALEFYPLSAETQRNLVGLPNPGVNPLGFCGYLLRRWFTFLTGYPRWKRNAKILAEHSDFQLISKIVEGYAATGQPLMGKKWMRVMELQGDISVGKGRLIYLRRHSGNSDWMALSDFAVRRFGCPSVTSETFPVGEIGMVGIDWRKKQTLTFLESILDTLDGD